jgi:molybdopterin molybdotransferase
MLSVDEAVQHVLKHARAGAAVMCPLREALGLVLAEDVAADIDSPPYDKSVVDGYAVIAAEVAEQAELTVIEEIAAGAIPLERVVAGTATRIMTGAPIPSGADAVIMVEQTESLEGGPLGRVRLDGAVKAGQNIMRRAASMARGQKVLPAGRMLSPIEIGLLAEVGQAQLRAIPRPTVAVLVTGNELVKASQSPGPGQIRNSNGPMLAAAAEAAGATVVELGIGRDNRAELGELVGEGLKADMLIVSGGVSAGRYDLVPEVLQQSGVRQVFHKVHLKPGKPVWFGTKAGAADEKLVFGLPGNPVSSLVCFELFVRPAIGRLAGRGDTALSELEARLTIDHVSRGDRPTYHPARLTSDHGQQRVEPLRWQGSGDLRTLAEANSLACFPPGERAFRAGEAIRVLRLPRAD